MGKFSGGSKSVDTDKIRREEEARLKAEARKGLEASEEARRNARARAFGGGEDEEISRKKLLGA